MKMDKDKYLVIRDVFMEKREAILDHQSIIRNGGKFKDLNTRVGFDSYYGLIPEEQRKWIAEGLADDHIKTAIFKAMKEASVFAE